MKLNGPISDKLRKIFSSDDPAWNPGRPASPSKPAQLPKGVKGQSLGGRHRKGSK